MKRLTNKPWFGPKRLIGWGWAPTSWEGGVVAITYLVFVALTFYHSYQEEHTLNFVRIWMNWY